MRTMSPRDADRRDAPTPHAAAGLGLGLLRRASGASGGLALLAIGLVVIAAVADADAARDMVVLAGVAAALFVILGRVRSGPAAERPTRVHVPTPEPVADSAEQEARAHFVALAAHEIRTPLTGILGLADLLAETSLSAEQTSYVRALRGSGAALLRLVDGYLDLSRLEAGHVEPTPIATALETVVEEVVELLAPPCQAKGLELAGYVSSSLATPVSVDPLLLRQVLINLAGNAVKFTETGGVAIEVERVAAGGRVLFRVRDTGIGIDPAEASRIFDAWERVETDGATAPSGTGLGLAIARGIVDRLGGTIELTSRPGEGSVFHFTLDLPPAGEDVRPGRPLAGRRIAVVSRAAVEPPLLLRRLHALGAEAMLAEDAVALLGHDAPDVVLVDGHGAVDPAEVLADLRGVGIAAPAVVLVAPTGRGELPRLREAGFAAHLVRPVRAASLARVVALAADGARPAPTRRAPEPTTAAAPRSGLDVLVVDDNEINALLGRAALEHAGHRVWVARDGGTALEAVAAAHAEGRPFAAILMDLHMPGLDGFAAIRAIRSEEPEGSRALVVALTADTTPAAAERALAAGADATMVKPIDRDRLAELLDDRPNARRAG